MKKDEVKIGGFYTAKVSDKRTTVKIDRVNPRGGWAATNIQTGKAIRIKSAQRLRGETRGPGEKAEPVDAAQDADVAASAAQTPAAEAPAKTAGARRPNAEKPTTERKLCGLDAAAQVLAEAGGPLNTKDMVERMLAGGLWKTDGKTPTATIYAAIIREIATKGEKARFKKVERGKFEVVLPY